MNHFRKKIEPIQEWNGEKLHFERDSSPEAWRHFKKYYTTEHWDDLSNYDFESLHFYSRTKKSGIYSDTPVDVNNALFVFESGNFLSRENDVDYYHLCKRLKGDVDFNFNEKHFPYFKRLLDDIEDINIRETRLAQLEDCKKMHHTLLNFSLMQSMGKMQQFKGASSDRLDTFVYKLSEYYKLEKDDRCNAEIIENSLTKNTHPLNKEYLQEYLDDFDGIYDYCKKVYFINDKAFVNEIIENGKKKITESGVVSQYMKLAIEFWDRKEKYFGTINK